MRLYALQWSPAEHDDELGERHGYTDVEVEWFGSGKDADERANEIAAFAGGDAPEVVEHDVPTTRAELITWLQRHQVTRAPLRGDTGF